MFIAIGTRAWQIVRVAWQIVKVRFSTAVRQAIRDSIDDLATAAKEAL
jgi:hypothetical protein